MNSNNDMPLIRDWDDPIFNALPEHFFCFLLDREGRYLKLRAPDLTRLWDAPESHIGKHLSEILPGHLLEDRLYYFAKALRTKQRQEYTYPHFRNNRRHMTCIITPVVSSDEIVSVVMVVYDSIVAPVPAPFVLGFQWEQ